MSVKICCFLLLVTVLGQAQAQLPTPNLPIAPNPTRYPCMCGTSPVQCFVDPCSVAPPGKCAKSCISSYCDGCEALCTCVTDADCKHSEWCSPTSNPALKVCKTFSYTNETCGGFTPIGCQERCAPGYQCLFPPGVIDASGKCFPFCEKGECCGDKYCSPNRDICLPNRSCYDDKDCAAQNLPVLAPIGCRWTCKRPPFGLTILGTCSRTCNPIVVRPQP